MKLNTTLESPTIRTHEGGRATCTDAFHELKRSVLTCLLWENTFYESGSSIAERIAELVPKVSPDQVAALACEARDRMQLRHVPLFLLSELSKIKGAGPLVANSLAHVIQRADELTEFLAIYWKDKKHPLSAGIKRGLARAFVKFDAYRLAKYDRESKIKLRDVLFLTHAKPKDEEQAAIWKKLINGTLESPDTWEVALSAGKDKKETFERLLREGQLGGLAVLRNLRNMQTAGVDDALIRSRLSEGAARALPFRFVTAARYAPTLEDALETAMLKAAEGLDSLPGKTGLLIDVSGSMDAVLSAKSEATRVDAASGLAILLREKAEAVRVATFSSHAVEVPPRRGFALRDAIAQSQAHASTELRGALESLRAKWCDCDRLIVVTDEQSSDGISTPVAIRNYVVNVAAYKNGVSYRNGWTHIDGWSEQVVSYIREVEQGEE
jgi:60 kDa SS-A/Ro ribonucleoprotein